MAALNFDATTVAPAEAFAVIPAGKYKVQVVDSEMKATANGNGQYLWLEMEILDGEYQGRKLWDRLNLKNPNAQAVEIAERALSALCHATGKLRPKESDDLHFIPVLATVKVRPPREQYDASNEIRGYEAVMTGAKLFSGTTAATRSAAPTKAPARAAAPDAVAPWKQKAPKLTQEEIDQIPF